MNCQLFDKNDEQCNDCEQTEECINACWRGWNSLMAIDDIHFEDRDLGAM